MTTNKFFPILLILVITESCASQSLITFASGNDCNNCINCVKISKEIESDSIYNELLRSYVYSAMIGAKKCKYSSNDFDKVFERISFIKTILTLYDNKSIEKNNIFETNQSFSEFRRETLFKCSNNKILHEIADSLLYKNIFDGIEALWDSINPNFIPNLNIFMNKNESVFIIASMAVVYHNSSFFEKRDILLDKLKGYPKFKNSYAKLKILLKEPKIKLLEFDEQILGPD